MSPTEMLSDLRARGVELRLADGAARLEARGPITDNDRDRIRAERLWLLMLLAHEAGGDAYDPKLTFVASAERGLTRGAIRTRMEVAFGISRDLAEALIELAHEAGYLRKGTDGLYWPHGQTGFQLLRNRSDALATE